MKDFENYLEESGEIGYVEEVIHSLIYASGLPGAHPNEVVVFESGDLGQILSLEEEYVEVLLLTSTKVKVGSRIARTGEALQIRVDKSLLGRVIDPLGRAKDKKAILKDTLNLPIDTEPPKLMMRKEVESAFETGVSLVDLVVPLGRGQRELVIGDRKTGKTEFLLQTVMTQAKVGSVCIYAVVGQKQVDIKKLQEFFQEKGIDKNTLIVASSSSEPSGLIYLTPFSAMTIAEYFRDQGMDVLLVLDDMTTHARNYREISLLAKRFPGKSAYPGDIFYLQARLVERAGNFKKGSITLLPVAESILGDLSGYIQTNLMAMTDGHIFFDIDLYNEGKRPAVNPYLSVTRVGHQTQSALARDVSRELSSFLVTYERMKQFLHFGAEIGNTARNILNLGSKLDAFFNQSADLTVPLSANLLILGGLWAGIWTETKLEDLPGQMEQVLLSYQTDKGYKSQVDELIKSLKSFSDLVNNIRRNREIIESKIKS